MTGAGTVLKTKGLSAPQHGAKLRRKCGESGQNGGSCDDLAEVKDALGCTLKEASDGLGLAHQSIRAIARHQGILFPCPASDVEKIRRSAGYLLAYAKDSDETGSQVYFMEDREGSIKIGFSTRPHRRRREIASDFLTQCGTTKSKISLIATAPGGRETERMLHLAFASTRRPSCEWFDPSPELLSLIAELQAQGGSL